MLGFVSGENSKVNEYKSLVSPHRKLSIKISIESGLENNIFYHKDGSLGVTYKVELIGHEPMSMYALDEVTNAYNTVLKLNKNITADYFFIQRAAEFDEDKVEKHLLNAENKVAADLIRGRLKFLNSKKFKKWQHECYLSFKKAPNMAQKVGFLSDIRGVFESENQCVRDEKKTFDNELREFEKFLNQVEHAPHLRLKRIDESEYRTIFSKIESPEIVHHRKRNERIGSVSEGLFSKPIELEDDRGKIGDNYLCAYTLGFSKYKSLGLMSYFLELDFPFIVSVSLSRRNTQAALKFKTGLLKNSFNQQGAYLDILETQSQIEKGDFVCNIIFKVLLYGGSKEELKRNESSFLKSSLITKGKLEFFKETQIFPLMLVSSLPQNFDKSMEPVMQREAFLHLSDVKYFIPCFGGYSHTSSEKVQNLHLTKYGEPIHVNLREGLESYHTLIFGSTGKGKSFYSNSNKHGLMAQKLAPIVYIMEIKSSNKMACQFFGGEFNDFSKDKSNYNPFGGTYNKDKINFLVNYIKSAIKMTSEKFDIDGVLTDYIKKALISAYNERVRESVLSYVDGEIVETGYSSERICLKISDLLSQLSYLQSELTGESDLFARINYLKKPCHHLMKVVVIRIYLKRTKMLKI